MTEIDIDYIIGMLIKNNSPSLKTLEILMAIGSVWAKADSVKGLGTTFGFISPALARIDAHRYSNSERYEYYYDLANHSDDWWMGIESVYTEWFDNGNGADILSPTGDEHIRQRVQAIHDRWQKFTIPPPDPRRAPGSAYRTAEYVEAERLWIEWTQRNKMIAKQNVNVPDDQWAAIGAHWRSEVSV